MGFRFGQIALSLVIIHSIGYSLDLTQYPINSQIDVIEYKNNKYEISLVNKESDKESYTPNTKIYDINFSAKEYKTKFGNIVIYDLSKNDIPYINILEYDKLIIKGDIQECHLAISDRKLFFKEDNIPLDITNNQIDIKQLYKNLDITKIKAIILFKSNPKCNIRQISLHKNRSKPYINLKTKATWIWNPDTNISINKLHKYNINKVYLQVKNGFKTTALKLSDNNITIFGLNGSPNDIYNYEHLKNDILLLSKLKASIPNIKGYQIDVEPYILKEFQTNREDVLNAYVNMIKSLSSLCKKHNLEFSIVIPFWYHTIYNKYDNIVQTILNYADELVLMSYRSDLLKVIDISKNILRMGTFSDKNILIGIEFIKIPDEYHTRYKIISKNSCITQNGFAKECKILQKIRSYTIKGSSISFYNQLDKLSHIDKIEIPFNSFKGFVFHHYSVLP